MPSQADLIFAKIVVLNNLASEDQIRQCLESVDKMEAMGQRTSLEQILIQQGYLNQEQIKKIKTAQELHFRVQEDHKYGKLCIQKGFVNQRQIQECLEIQKQRQYKERLYQILVSKNYLTPAQHKQIAPMISRMTPPPGTMAPVSGLPGPVQAPTPPSDGPSGFSSRNGDPFAQVVVQQNLATPKQVQECIDIQKKLRAMGIDKALSAVMLDKNYLSSNQVSRIMGAMGGGGSAGQVSTQTASPAKTTPPPAQKKKKSPIEGYEIECKLGQGAMGVIYKGRHEKLQRIVALKVLLPEFANDKEFIQRFFREAKAAITLHHPNIIQGYHVGESNGFYYFAMEYVEGGTVKEKIQKTGLLPEMEAIDIVTQICRALEHAQENGIVHRDIKPDNIMMTTDGEAKLCDLGIAKEINQDGSLTQTGIALGTPYYISPEQAMGEKKIDIRSDIYSLGATFYHMVTGKVPYEGDTSAVIMTKHISEDPPDPRAVNPTVSQGTANVIMQMMAKDRAYRFQNPTEVSDQLEAVKNQEIPRFGSGSSVFIQDGLKIPKKSVTRISQIRQAPKMPQGRKSVLVTTQQSNYKKGPVAARGSMVSKAAYQQKKSNPLPILIGVGIVMIVLILVLVLVFFSS